MMRRQYAYGQQSADLTNIKATANSPFVVGVSGHRNLSPADVPRLRDAVTDFINQLRRHLPDTELEIIVGMAEGADLLVAQTALDLGVRVQAVLPAALEHYSDDFEAQSLALLKGLLARPDVRCIELSPPGHLRDDHGVANGSRPDALYENLTDTLIRRSSLLLALWDGYSSLLPGGTADTVLRYLGVRTDAGREDMKITFVEAGAEPEAAERVVYWAPAARGGSAVAAQAGMPCFLVGVGDNVLEVQRDMPVKLAQQLKALNHYNREYQELVAARAIGAADSLAASLPANAPVAENMMLGNIDSQYGKADALAVHYQLRSDRLFMLFGLMTFTMGLAFLIYEQITEARLLLIAYVLVLLSSLGVYYVLRGRNWFAKHLTYRAIAETMRAKFYLRLAGVDHRVDAAEVLGLSGIDRFRGFGWISYVLKGVEAPDIHAAVSPEDAGRRSRCVEHTWIEHQYRYFAGKVSGLEKSARRIQRLRNALLLVMLVVVVILFVFGQAIHNDRFGVGVPLKNMLTFCMGFLAVLLGVWELHQGKMATRELLWQYRNQLNHFTKARRQLATISSLRRRDDVLVALGKNSLMESYLWTIHRYHREHEPPAR
jgi:hypothetical protein